MTRIALIVMIALAAACGRKGDPISPAPPTPYEAAAEEE